MALSEQSVGAVGFLQAMGLNNDQMHGLFAVVLLGCLIGIAVSALTVKPVLTRVAGDRSRWPASALGR